MRTQRNSEAYNRSVDKIDHEPQEISPTAAMNIRFHGTCRDADMHCREVAQFAG
jgi:hypothetical protein